MMGRKCLPPFLTEPEAQEPYSRSELRVDNEKLGWLGDMDSNQD